MNFIGKKIVAVVGITILLILCYLGLIIYINWPSERVIAKDLEFTPEWTELPLDPAIVPRKRDQYLTLRIKDYMTGNNVASLKSALRLPDGTVVDPQIELCDASGNAFTFRHSGSVTKFHDEPVFRAESDSGSFDLPRDHQYIKLRIRSEVPFKVDRIAWQDYYPK